ncbi:MAG: phospho-N-acetylmuramoyl-pentapeptide-transferase [Candidatus Acetothermia bacterium]|nr:phospho-N-acetylmuramoyl-pentapeptide-transferase [Candidatus Acetothermia bacterium]
MEGLTLALLLAFVMVPAVAGASSAFARWGRVGQYVRPEGPARHAEKAGTPTMGGIVPLGAILVGAGVLWGAGGGPTWASGFVLAATGAGAGMGLLDDLRSQRRRASLGFFPHQTLLIQAALGGALFAMVPFLGGLELAVPFSSVRVPLSAIPWWALLLLVLVAFVATTNAVNLTDGLDGLATGAWVLALLGLLPMVGGKPDLVGLCLLGIGAGAGFLWANAHPAHVFLGNVGSMGLGGFLFGVSFAGGAVFLLPLLGGLFVVETLSVILQVASYKLTGTRLLKMSPLHHHLEAGSVPWRHLLPGREWPEPKVVARLWIVAGAFALLGVLAWIAN